MINIHRPTTIRASDVIVDDDQAEHYERSYRKGVHQALAFAADLSDRASSLGELRRLLARAENVAADLRYRRKHVGRGMLLDEIGSRLHARRKARASR
jgi:hypothetical protein